MKKLFYTDSKYYKERKLGMKMQLQIRIRFRVSCNLVPFKFLPSRKETSGNREKINGPKLKFTKRESEWEKKGEIRSYLGETFAPLKHHP